MMIPLNRAQSTLEMCISEWMFGSCPSDGDSILSDCHCGRNFSELFGLIDKTTYIKYVTWIDFDFYTRPTRYLLIYYLCVFS